MRANVWLAGGSTSPGRYCEVEFDATVTASGIETDHVIVADAAVAPPGHRDLRFPTGNGGGPAAAPEAQHDADRFGAVHAAFHADRAMRHAARLIGRALPPLVVRVAAHGRWGGGHYRLPAAVYSDHDEALAPCQTGEVHLGRGSRYLSVDGQRYYNAASHNAAIIYHEVGHHLCRHTADFRMNDGRPPDDQANGKIPLDEGFSDYFAATLLGTPDIFGWHRADVPAHAQDRRSLDGPWTMADFRGGHDQDPHRDGTVWACALWSARTASIGRGISAERFDQIVGRALLAMGTAEARSEEALRERRYVGRAAAAVIAAADDGDGDLPEIVARAFARRGIVPGFSNAALRDLARTDEAVRAGRG